MGRQWARNRKKKEDKKKRQPVGDFDSWYEAYPLKRARKTAELEYNKLITSGEISPDDLLARTKAYAATVIDLPREQRRYVPHPANWLKSGRYDDQPDVVLATDDLPNIETPMHDYRTFGDAEWLDCMETYLQTGNWPERYWGPAPGKPGCAVPSHLIVKQVVLQVQAGQRD